MNRIDYVSTKTAIELKKHGFNEFCRYVYNTETNEINITTDRINSNLPNICCSIPLLYFAYKWIRNKYNYHINIITDYNGKYDYNISKSLDDEINNELNNIEKNIINYRFKSYEESLDNAIYNILLNINDKDT